MKIYYYTFKSFEDNYLNVFKHLEDKNITLKQYLMYLRDWYSEISEFILFNFRLTLTREESVKAKEFISDYFDLNMLIPVIKKCEYENMPKVIYRSNFDISFIDDSDSSIGVLLLNILNEFSKIINLIEKELIRLDVYSIQENPKLIKRQKLSNPKKLALLHELGLFDLPIMKKLSEDSQNEIVSLLLDANKKEFVYKNRLNINSKSPNYQTDKYTSYQYLDEMRMLLYEIE